MRATWARKRAQMKKRKYQRRTRNWKSGMLTKTSHQPARVGCELAARRGREPAVHVERELIAPDERHADAVDEEEQQELRPRSNCAASGPRRSRRRSAGAPPPGSGRCRGRAGSSAAGSCERRPPPGSAAAPRAGSGAGSRCPEERQPDVSGPRPGPSRRDSSSSGTQVSSTASRTRRCGISSAAPEIRRRQQEPEERPAADQGEVAQAARQASRRRGRGAGLDLAHRCASRRPPATVDASRATRRGCCQQVAEGDGAHGGEDLGHLGAAVVPAQVRERLRVDAIEALPRSSARTGSPRPRRGRRPRAPRRAPARSWLISSSGTPSASAQRVWPQAQRRQPLTAVTASTTFSRRRGRSSAGRARRRARGSETTRPPAVRNRFRIVSVRFMLPVAIVSAFAPTVVRSVRSHCVCFELPSSRMTFSGSMS